MSESDGQIDQLIEPTLLFGHGQRLADPKDGLYLFGPVIDRAKPAEMRIGVIGTKQGIQWFHEWVRHIAGHIPAGRAEQHHLAFPGFEAAFKTAWPAQPIVELEVSPSEIANSVRISEPHERVFKTVDIYEGQIRRYLREEEAVPAMWFVVIPDDVHRFCRPKSPVPSVERIQSTSMMTARVARRLNVQPSMFIEDMIAAEPFKYEVDFHNQLKARLLDKQAVLQIVRESTLAPEAVAAAGGPVRRMQDPATVAWNLCTTAFFKAGGRPWALANVREDVCYIGLVFKKKDSDPNGGNACCGAQMFLGSGDGLVFKGAVGPWYSPTNQEFHLPRGKAAEIAALVVEAYKEKHGKPPKELFIHAKQHFSDEEWVGFASSVSEDTKLVGVRIQTSKDVKLFRYGRSPILRGAAYRVGPNLGYLWTTGFVPHLQTYAGRETPNPLMVEITRGRESADLLQVMQDILGLTKLNFNACIYADGLPVTLRFADDVGEILTAAPIEYLPPLPFKHYI